MRVLIVGNHKMDGGTRFAHFVEDQMFALKKAGVEIFAYGITQSGINYIKEIAGIRKAIKEYHPDIIHAHYGLCGLLCNIQSKVPVVTTYHGSDIHSGGWVLKLSQLSMRLSAFNIFVTNQMFEMSGYKGKNACIQSCGLNLDIIRSIPREEARKILGINQEKKIVLFASNKEKKIKNYPLAKAAVDLIPNVELVELKGQTREGVCLMMNACNVQLTTSFKESGPLVVKEAMACGTPVVSVDVGDVREIIGDIKGNYIAERNPEDIAAKLKQALAYKGKTCGRERIKEMGLSNDIVAKNIINEYNNIIIRYGEYG